MERNSTVDISGIPVSKGACSVYWSTFDKFLEAFFIGLRGQVFSPDAWEAYCGLWSFFVLQSWWVGSQSGSLLSYTYPFQANITWFLISISLPFTIILSTQTEESGSTAICEMTVLGTAYILVFSSTLFSCLRQLVYFYNNYNNEHGFLSLLENQLSRGHVRSKFFAVQNAGWEWRNWKLLCSTCLGLSAVTTRQQIEHKDPPLNSVTVG